MSVWLKHPWRVTGRLAWMMAELLWMAFTYALRCGGRSGHSLARARSVWLQQSTRRLLRIFRADVRVRGEIPKRGLFVSNHLGYVDILVLASLTPAVFVAKHEVKSWPVFGWFAQLAGTIFVQREKRAKTAHVTRQIEHVLDREVLVILFPEGTSSNGETVLPFKSALLEPATKFSTALSVGWIHYELDDGDPREEVCYWRDEVTLVSHLINLFSKRSVRAQVCCSRFSSAAKNRKALAQELHGEVLKLKAAREH
ncbi:MAG TPA: lysophospholipid acyltransferase family protein [Verrucomicrobiae bacterium]